MQLLNDKIDGSGSPENVLPAAEWNQLPTELQNIITALGMTLSNGDLNQLGKALAGYVANGAFYTDSGIADAYVLNAVGGKQSLPEYTDGAKVEFVTTNPNTGAATVNVTGNGVKNIKLNDGSDPLAGNINGRTILKFDGANDWFELEFTDVIVWRNWFFSDAFSTGSTHSVSTEDTSPGGIVFKPDGTKMYVTGSANNSVYQYTLSTAWDLDTASYDSVSYDITAQDGSPTGVSFKPDGTKMYIVGTTNDSVYQYTLSTAWDVGTASYDSVSFSTASEDTDPDGLFIREDGTKMYIAGDTGNSIYQYTLATAWDLSTASYDSVFYDVSTQVTGPTDVFFRPDGTYMYVPGYDNQKVTAYALSTAWDVSTASYHDDYVVSNFPHGIFFKPKGDIMFVMDSQQEAAIEHSTSRAFQWY